MELLRGFTPLISIRAPSHLACRTRTVWQYQYVPSLSGLLPTLPGISRIRLPSAPIESLRRLDGGVLSPPHGHKAPRGARFPCSTRLRPSWDRAPSVPRGWRCSHDRCCVSDRRLPPLNGRPLSPRHTTRPGELLTRHQQGFKSVRPSSLPLTCGPPDGAGDPWASPELHTPWLPKAHVRAGTGPEH